MIRPAAHANADTLTGTTGADSLTGFGGAGADSLTGAAGADRLSYEGSNTVSTTARISAAPTAGVRLDFRAEVVMALS